jgi:hypothetical protein
MRQYFSSMPPPQTVSFGPTSPQGASAVREFLCEIFKLAPDAPVFDPATADWKYFDAHPWWPEARSYTLQTPAGIAAHGCVSPVRFDCHGQTVDSMQIIDWAAGRQIPAAGLLLYRRCLEHSKGTLLAIGGSADTRTIIPQVSWFARKEDLFHFARPLRPGRHLARSARGWRSLARFGRNMYWSVMPGLPDARRWSCRKARAGEAVFAQSGPFVPILRTRAWFDYLLRCPAARTELVILEDSGAARGHAFLSEIGGAVQVADFVVAAPASQAEKTAAFSALLRYIAAQPESAEVVASSSLRGMGEVFLAAGLRPRGSSPVYLADPKKLLPRDLPLEITPLIGDAFYLRSLDYPFVC